MSKDATTKLSEVASRWSVRSRWVCPASTKPPSNDHDRRLQVLRVSISLEAVELGRVQHGGYLSWWSYRRLNAIACQGFLPG